MWVVYRWDSTHPGHPCWTLKTSLPWVLGFNSLPWFLPVNHPQACCAELGGQHWVLYTLASRLFGVLPRGQHWCVQGTCFVFGICEWWLEEQSHWKTGHMDLSCCLCPHHVWTLLCAHVLSPLRYRSAQNRQFTSLVNSLYTQWLYIRCLSLPFSVSLACVSPSNVSRPFTKKDLLSMSPQIWNKGI